MNRVMLSLVLSMVFSVLVILGVGFFHVMSSILNSNIAVLAVGFGLLYLLCFIVVSNLDNDLEQTSVIENDDEDEMFN